MSKCVHKGCGKVFTDPDEPCIYHPGPPDFHEGQKGWKCCKRRVLTFDEFLEISPCTTGKHSTVDDTPAPPSKPAPPAEEIPAPSSIPADAQQPDNLRTPLPVQPAIAPQSPAPPPESESDEPSATPAAGASCRRKGCKGTYSSEIARDDEECVYHPGAALFHEGSKGWTCCKRRVLEFDEFMKIPGCKAKKRHLFIGKDKAKGEEKVQEVRTDFYQTPTQVIASYYLKKIDKATAKVDFSSPTTVDLDLPTSDNKRYGPLTIPLFGSIDTEKSSYRVLGTKLELTLHKADGTSWPVLRNDEKWTGERIQVGRAGRV